MYLNIKGFDNDNQNLYWKLAKDECKKLKKNYHVIVLPVYNRETYVQVFYPSEMNGEEINFPEEFAKNVQFKNVRIKLDKQDKES